MTASVVVDSKKVDAACRPGKFSGCAHFTLRCRRQLPNGEAQLPMVALVFNFRADLLTFSEAKTVFHELGHAMHSILSRTQFQHLAGLPPPLPSFHHLIKHTCTSPTGEGKGVSFSGTRKRSKFLLDDFNCICRFSCWACCCSHLTPQFDRMSIPA